MHKSEKQKQKLERQLQAAKERMEQKRLEMSSVVQCVKKDQTRVLGTDAEVIEKDAELNRCILKYMDIKKKLEKYQREY